MSGGIFYHKMHHHGIIEQNVKATVKFGNTKGAKGIR